MATIDATPARHGRLIAWIALNVLAWTAFTLWWDRYAGFQAFQAYAVDAWTYLFPALEVLEGGAFDPGKRPFLYPLYLLVNLSLGLGTQVIVAQQLLAVALAAGLVAYPIARALPAPWRYVVASAFMGVTVLWPLLNVVAHYFASEVAYALALSGLVVFAWWMTARFRPPLPRGRLLMVAALVPLLAFLPLWIKSHWMIGAWVSVVGLGALLLLRIRRAGQRPMPALAVLVAATALVAWLPGQLNNTALQSDFGMRTVFCNHYHIVRDYWQRDPRILAMLDREELEALDEELVMGFQVGQRFQGPRQWSRLGYYGDWCLLRSTKLEALLPDEADRDAFYRANVRLLLTSGFPDYVGKVTTQLVYAFMHPIRSRATMGSRGLFNRTGNRLDSYGDWSRRLGLIEQDPGSGGRPIGFHLPGLPLLTLGVDALFLLAALRIALSGMAALPWRRRITWDSPFQRSMAGFGGLMLMAFGLHALLIAATHTFDIWRYVATVQPLVFGVIFCGGLCLLADAKRLTGRRPGRNGQST